MPVEETGETRVRMDFLISMFPYAYKLKKQISIRERRHWEYILGGF